MKKKNVYRWMGVIVGLSIILYAIIYFLHLQNKAITMANAMNGGKPTFSYYLQGDVNNPLDKPMDVTKVGEFVYVTDTNHKQVQVFDSSGSPVFKFGKDGTGKGQFKFPYGIAGDKDGNVYVADLYNGNISVFTPKGKFIKYFTDENKKADFIKSPGGLRIVNDKLYITDIQKGKVLVYSMSGKKLLEISTATAKNDPLSAPNAVTVDDQQNIYVSDSGNQRICIFDKTGKFLSLINGSKDGKGDSKLVNPRGIGVLANGTILFVDSMTHYVYGYDQKGNQLYQFGGLGSDREQFYLPNGLFVDDKGEIFITDTVNARVAVYY